MERLVSVKALTFDLFGTVLDLGGSLNPFIAKFLEAKGATVAPGASGAVALPPADRTVSGQYHDARAQRVLETARRAFVYTLGLNQIQATKEEVRNFMLAWQELSPFPEVVPALSRLKTRFKLVALSNGEPQFLDHLVKNRIRWDFDGVISVQLAERSNLTRGSISAPLPS